LLLSFFNSSKQLLASTGTVVTTLFEGKQYDPWDIRALAKSAGFRAQRSFRFSADMYPGYSHARTLGNIRGGGGWKGEERSARTYIFELDDGVDKSGRASTKKRKRSASCGSSSDEVNS
jgi:25S rRNA (uracil2634-N3)-methyltransferase